eukprot:15167960-Alexandrium_andersonii.AAC.1
MEFLQRSRCPCVGCFECASHACDLSSDRRIGHPGRETSGPNKWCVPLLRRVLRPTVRPNIGQTVQPQKPFKVGVDSGSGRSDTRRGM